MSLALLTITTRYIYFISCFVFALILHNGSDDDLLDNIIHAKSDRPIDHNSRYPVRVYRGYIHVNEASGSYRRHQMSFLIMMLKHRSQNGYPSRSKKDGFSNGFSQPYTITISNPHL